MKKYNFDTVVNRYGTDCIKYDFSARFGKPSDILPLWVADMDFVCPDEIRDAVRKTADHGIYGYTDSDSSYFNAVAAWMKKQHNWDVQSEWLCKTPGIVFAIVQAIRAFTKEGDAVIIQQPVYHPFSRTVLDNRRKLVNSQLIYKDGRYTIDFEDFEKKITDSRVKLFILCSPHNPIGRVWKKEELVQLGTICRKHNVIVVSDEIHSDFVYAGNTHTVFTQADPSFKDFSIVCTAPSKTFNMAGLQCSNIFIENSKLRKEFADEVSRCGCDELNAVAIAAGRAAYLYGENWLMQLKEYLADNLSFVRSYIKSEMPKAHLVEPEGTYLIWIDFSGYEYNEKELNDRIVNKAKVWLDEGSMFGPESPLFQRINIACPRITLEKCFRQLSKAL